MRRLAALAAVLLLTACAGSPRLSTPAATAADGWTPMVVRTRTIGLGIPGGVRLARGVRFAGGLELMLPPGHRLHGLSDLKTVGDDLLAVTDAGDLVRGRLALDRRGRPIGLAAVQLRALTRLDGGPFGNKGDGDAESLIVTPDGEVIVGFEKVPRVWSYGRLDALESRPTALPTPPVPPGNTGLEALALAVDGDGWRAAGEGGGVWDCDRRACNEVTAPPAAEIPVSDWRITGMDRDPEGTGWFVVQRRFREPADARARVRRMDRSGTMGPVLIELALPSTTDNFEGIAVVAEDDGVRLHLLSDDNSNDRQRTLLLAFDVRPAR